MVFCFVWLGVVFGFGLMCLGVGLAWLCGVHRCLVF